MSSQQLDEEAIVEVARDLRNPAIRAKYLSQVCADHELRSRLEQKCKRHRGWQFSLRTLLIIMLLGGALSAGIAISIRTMVQARQMAIDASLRVRHAEQAALQARQEAERQRVIAEHIQQAQATLKRRSRDVSSEETTQ